MHAATTRTTGAWLQFVVAPVRGLSPGIVPSGLCFIVHLCLTILDTSPAGLVWSGPYPPEVIVPIQLYSYTATARSAHRRTPRHRVDLFRGFGPRYVLSTYL